MEPEKDQRPWGGYIVLDEKPDHKVKRLRVLPRKRFSLQKHQRRSEHWFVISGVGLATKDTEKIKLHAGDAIDIPAGMAHRMENIGTEDLYFIEVQCGDYFGEDDEERLEDDFGRV